MYQDELSREARLIARGYAEYASDVAAVWTSIRALFSFGTPGRR